jgi:hypothetical protein
LLCLLFSLIPDSFERVRMKLTVAKLQSDTDLNSSKENAKKSRRRRKPNRFKGPGGKHEDSNSEEEAGLGEVFKIKLPTFEDHHKQPLTTVHVSQVRPRNKDIYRSSLFKFINN